MVVAIGPIYDVGLRLSSCISHGPVFLGGGRTLEFLSSWWTGGKPCKASHRKWFPSVESQLRTNYAY